MSLLDYLAKAVRPRFHEKFAGILAAEVSDDADLLVGPVERDATTNDSLTGLSIIIEYEDARRRRTQRSITCRSFQVAASTSYVHAYCHHRQALRSFRLDRILEVFDPLTGESLGVAFFERFAPNRITKSSLSWGLSVSKRASLVHLLNALVFIARCDKEFHPSERDSLEQAITRFWLHSEIAADCPVDDILGYADRLAPDGETFWVAMSQIKEDAVLTSLFRRAATQLIEADGIIRREETYWAIEIDDFLRDSS
jgi:hypothetical protein